ncbi:MAG: Ig-like domain-containing protein [Anaerolineae bacterium]|nr:Ig-like domain-containing protein [Anaerolineae bacterium]
MRRYIGVMAALLALLAISLPQMAAQDEVATLTILQVVDSDPLEGQELGLNDPITLYFDRTLNCATVAAALSITPAVAGDFTCDSSRVTFTPADDYERATTYTVSVSTAIRSSAGMQMLEPFALALTTTGFLQVAEAFPGNITEASVPTNTDITIVFNRPVVPLVLSSDMSGLPVPLSIEPETAGSGEWVNSSIYTFKPAENLVGGIEYVVTVPAGLTAVDGSVLPEDYSFRFNTPFPLVDRYDPLPNTSDVGLRESVEVRFNMPMDRASTEADFYLRHLGEQQAVEGRFIWNDSDTGFRFQPLRSLAMDTVYEAGFNNTARARNSPATLAGVTTWTFATVPFPAIVSTDPRDGADTPPYGGFSLNFASPMDPATLQDKISISPEPERPPEFYYRDWSNSYSVSFAPEPATTYTVTVAPGMADLYGNRIEEALTFSYTTGDYDPNLRLNVPGRVGFYNAYRAPTQFFLTHTNISRLDLSLYQPSLDEIIQQLATSDYYDAPILDPNPADLLKTWTIPNVAPRNVLRYELVQPAQAVPADAECRGALTSRLAVGDQAIVINEPDALRARSQPTTDSDIVELLYEDYALEIVGGPVCTDDSLLWWEVALREDRRAWVVESFEGEYMLALNPAFGETSVTVTGSDDGRLPPGAYYISVSVPEFADETYTPSGHFMLVSTTVLTLKISQDEVTVWATDVQTGQPQPDAAVVLYDFTGEEIARGRTDAGGVVRFSIAPREDLFSQLVAVLNEGELFGMGFSNWTNGLELWQFGINYDFFPRQYSVYAYTDRPLYRPGQPVYFRAVVRRKDDVRYFVPDLQVPVQIFDDRGELVYDELLPLSEFGTISGQFDLSADAALGYYYLSIDLPSRYEYQSEGGGISFSVAEYRLPEFEVDVTPVTPQVVQGDTASYTVASTYYFGGAVAGATVNYSVVSTPYTFNYTGDGYYDFYDINYDGGPSDRYDYYGGEIASGSLTAAADGSITIDVPAELKDAASSQLFTLEATVSDETNQTVSGRSEVIVHKGRVYVGVRPTRYVGQVDQDTSYDLITVDWDSQPVPNQVVEVQIVERRWSNTQERDPNTGETTWTWEVEEIPVAAGSVTTDAAGQATYSFVPPTGGVYKAIVETRDAAGNAIKASTMLWVSSREYVSWRQQNSNRIDLIADQDDYSVGDTAEILITSPFQGAAEALVTVERGRVLSVERITLEGNSAIYRLPITEDHAPNVFVGVLVIKGVDENNPVAGFRMGYVSLNVDISRQVMDIAITSDVDRAQPQQVVTYTLRTTDHNGDPVAAEVGVAVTDVAALALMPPNSGPILPQFYGPQALGVRSSTSLAINTDQLTQETLDTVKGGGGGGGGGGIITIRGEFVDTPYWNGRVVTGDDGLATFEVRLPDNLTTWRLDARGITAPDDGNMLVGQNTFELLSTKPLIVRPITPRFFIVGDQVLLSAVVNNNTDDAQEVVVTLRGTGFTFVNNDNSQTISIPAGGRGRVTWAVVIEDVAEVKAAFIADAGAFNDASISPVSSDDNGTLPVYKYEVPETVGTAGILRSNDSARLESIVLPRRFAVTEGELRVTLEQSLASATLDGLDYLRNYPHQCVEQTVSRFLPNVMTFKALNDLNLANDRLETNLVQSLNFALQKLYTEQKTDGGWGWFRNDRSNVMVTAYALLGLSVASDAGYTVSETVISAAQDFLQSSFVVTAQTTPRWQMNRQAFVLYVLTRSGARDIGRTVNLYDNRQNLSLWAKGFLAQTLATISPADTSRTDALLADIMSNVVISASGAHWEEDERDYYNWNTDLRTTAILLDTLVQLRPQSDLLPNVVRYLMVQRTADAWETTQETAWAVMALTDWMVASGELEPDYSYRVTLNEAELAAGAATPATVRETQELVIQVSELLQDEANNLLFERTEGQGALYYTAFLEASVPVPDVQPLSRGILLERRYINLSTGRPVTEAVVGEMLQVRLTIVNPTNLHYVVIEDPLPAGVEAINPNLLTSEQIGTRPQLLDSDPLSQGWGWWWFSNIEFRDEKVVLYSTYLPAGTYEYVYRVRAGIEGTYNVIPATGQEFYFPDVYGRTAGSTFTVLPE